MRVKDVLQRSLAVALKGAGFSKSGDLYLRKVGDVTHIVEVQWSRWNDPVRVRFTLNGGIYVPGVTSTFRKGPEPKRPKLTDCCISVRLGMLSDSRLDMWWELSANDNATRESQVEQEVVSATFGLLLPFLDRFRSPDQAAQFLSQDRSKSDEFVDPRAPALPSVYAGLLWAKLGDSDRALKCIDRAMMESKRTPLEDFVTQFGEEWKRRLDHHHSHRPREQ